MGTVCVTGLSDLAVWTLVEYVDGEFLSFGDRLTVETQPQVTDSPRTKTWVVLLSLSLSLSLSCFSGGRQRAHCHITETLIILDKASFWSNLNRGFRILGDRSRYLKTDKDEPQGSGS